jgi:hypothetical protein
MNSNIEDKTIHLKSFITIHKLDHELFPLPCDFFKLKVST